MNVLDIKKRLLQKQLNAIETINLISKELPNLAQDGTVKEVSGQINKLEKVLLTLKGKDFTDILNSINNQLSRKDLSNIEKILTKISEKDLEIKIKDLVRFPTEPKDAIPVVLTDKDRKSFYDAIKMLPVLLSGGNATEIHQLDGRQKTQIVNKNNENIEIATTTNQEITHEKLDDVNSNLEVVQDKQDASNDYLDNIKDNQTNGTQQSKLKETAPNDPTKNNPSLALSNADEVVASTKTLTMTIGATSYESTISYNAAGEFLSISEWEEV
jgi:hypothetical protein